MIYELRDYKAAPGKLAALNDRFRNHTLKLFAKHGMNSIGYWTDARDKDSNRLVYMLAFDDLDDMQQKWAAFIADEDWKAVRSSTEADGPLVQGMESMVLDPTDYSPLA